MSMRGVVVGGFSLVLGLGIWAAYTVRKERILVEESGAKPHRGKDFPVNGQILAKFLMFGEIVSPMWVCTQSKRNCPACLRKILLCFLTVYYKTLIL